MSAARRGGRFLLGLLPGRRDLTAMRRSPLRDLLAGATVALVALPLALAFGEASGVGAQAGLVTAVLAGAIAAVFGGSNLQVSGPTGAMTVVLVPVVHQHGVGGLLQVGAMAGVLLIVLAVTRIGRVVRYLPLSVVEGFTAGIAVVIALQQVPHMLGVAPGDEEGVVPLAVDAVRRFVAQPDPVAPLVTVGVAAVILVGARLVPAIPLSLLAVAIAAGVVALGGFSVSTIGELPPLFSAPDAAFLDPSRTLELLPAAAAVAALAALESLLCATVADGMTVGERHDPDRELLGQGLANLVVPFFGGVPATAAIARTAVNVRSGARSRLAALSHALILGTIVIVAAPLVSGIPLAALAGVLLATTIRMIDLGALRAIARSTWGDALVLVVTFAITVFVDLITAVAVGFGAAALLALRELARAARLDRVPLEEGDHADEEARLVDEHIVAYRIDGPVFFGAAHRFLHELTEVADVHAVILRLSRVTTIDATGARLLDDAVRALERRGITVLVSGIRPEHHGIFQRSGALAHLRAAGRVYPDTPEAIAAARELIAG
ncbi:MAG: SulP family inorganic anion transporter [Actinomycetales bacterium]|nr:SulP family inorganic anion transporter [Actinomycetales bacterium]